LTRVPPWLTGYEEERRTGSSKKTGGLGLIKTRRGWWVGESTGIQQAFVGWEDQQKRKRKGKNLGRGGGNVASLSGGGLVKKSGRKGGLRR